MSQKLPKNGYHEVMNNPNCYDFSYFVLFTYVFSLFLEVCYDFKRLRQSSTVVGSKVQVERSLEECKS